MNKDIFLQSLRRGLKGLSLAEIEDIVGDYTAHFAESEASGRQQAEVAAALGNPSRIARELRANSGLRRFEERRTIPNMLAALMGLVVFAIFDVFILLPLLAVACFITLCLAIGLIAASGFGLKMMVSTIVFTSGEILSATMGHLLFGAGLISCSLGAGALLLLAMGGAIRILGQYARLHFRLVKPTEYQLPEALRG